jgi:hypothetical protein
MESPAFRKRPEIRNAFLQTLPYLLTLIPVLITIRFMLYFPDDNDLFYYFKNQNNGH